MNKRIIYSVEPQRPSTKGWVMCLPHQATRFAVMQLTVWKQGGKKMRLSKKVADFSGPKAAERANAAMISLNSRSNYRKPKDPPKTPGSRFARSGRKVLFRSLTTDEYLGRHS